VPVTCLHVSIPTWMDGTGSGYNMTTPLICCCHHPPPPVVAYHSSVSCTCRTHHPRLKLRALLWALGSGGLAPASTDRRGVAAVTGIGQLGAAPLHSAPIDNILAALHPGLYPGNPAAFCDSGWTAAGVGHWRGIHAHTAAPAEHGAPYLPTTSAARHLYPHLHSVGWHCFSHTRRRTRAACRAHAFTSPTPPAGLTDAGYILRCHAIRRRTAGGRARGTKVNDRCRVGRTTCCGTRHAVASSWLHSFPAPLALPHALTNAYADG